MKEWCEYCESIFDADCWKDHEMMMCKECQKRFVFMKLPYEPSPLDNLDKYMQMVKDMKASIKRMIDE